MIYIYVLKLVNNKYYVGKTVNPHFRLENHFESSGSSWTKKYKPIQVHELRPDQSDHDEQRITQEYMAKYGIDNVRGKCKCYERDSNPRCLFNFTDLHSQTIGRCLLHDTFS